MSADTHRILRATRFIANGMFVALTALLPTCLSAQSRLEGFDSVGTQEQMTAQPVISRLRDTAGTVPCEFDPPNKTLSMHDVAARALCSNPLTHRAWVSTQIQAARLGEAKAAQWPTLSGVLSGSRIHTKTSSTNSWASQESYNGTARAAEVAFDWVVFDFGARSAETRKARELLVAASKSFNAAVLDVLYTSAHDYFVALTARAQADAAREAESNAARSLAAAHARMRSGVASIADELQARTAFNQAKLSVVRADSAWHEAIGTLALDMGLTPDVPLMLAEAPAVLPGSAPQLDAIRTLLDQALENHPRLLAARAELQAAQASIDSARAQALPTVHLQAGLSASNRPVASINAADGMSSTSRSSYVGMRLTIPFFEGFNSGYRIREARAQADLQQANIAQTEQQVALDVWKSYEAVAAGTHTVQQAQALLEDAGLAFDAAQSRYRVGVANIIELLHAQDALVAANQQRVVSMSDWFTARLSLAASLGKLDLGQMHNR